MACSSIAGGCVAGDPADRGSMNAKDAGDVGGRATGGEHGDDLDLLAAV
jgi:hypothetical protein